MFKGLKLVQQLLRQRCPRPLLLAFLVCVVFVTWQTVLRKKVQTIIQLCPSDNVNLKPGLKVLPVILFAYQRGGSSLTGRLLSQRSDAFYYFEPLKGLLYDLYGEPRINWLERPITYRVRPDGILRRQPEYELHAMLDEVNKMMNCQLSKMRIRTLAHHEFLYMSPQLRGFTNCFVTLKGNQHKSSKSSYMYHSRCGADENALCPYNFSYFSSQKGYLCKQSLREALQFRNATIRNFNSEKLEKLRECYKELRKIVDTCIPKVQNLCDASRVRVMKLIRVNMEFIGHYLAAHPKTLVVHLLRDPRGILRSRQIIPHYIRAPTIREEARHLCAAMLDHIRVREELERQYRGNFVTLRYEDVATDPLKAVRIINKFYGVKENKELRKNISRMMSDGSEYQNNIIRKNSTATAYAWRTRWSKRLIKDVDSQCGELYKAAGYEPYQKLPDY